MELMKRARELMKASKEVKYPYGGTDGAAYVARQVYQNSTATHEEKVFDNEFVREAAAMEWAELEIEAAEK